MTKTSTNMLEWKYQLQHQLKQYIDENGFYIHNAYPNYRNKSKKNKLKYFNLEDFNFGNVECYNLFSAKYLNENFKTERYKALKVFYKDQNGLNKFFAKMKEIESNFERKKQFIAKEIINKEVNSKKSKKDKSILLLEDVINSIHNLNNNIDQINIDELDSENLKNELMKALKPIVFEKHMKEMSLK